jgi:hypothetical protein
MGAANRAWRMGTDAMSAHPVFKGIKVETSSYHRRVVRSVGTVWFDCQRANRVV